MARPPSEPDYRRLLAAADDALAAAVARLRAAAPARAAGSCRALASRVRRTARALRRTQPPPAAAAAHAELVAALDAFRAVAGRRYGAEYTCPDDRALDSGRSARAEHEHTVVLALLAVDPAAERVRSAAARLTADGFPFGRFLPAPPPGGMWRPPDGAVLAQRNRPRRGDGGLSVVNRLDRDAAVSLVEESGSPADPALTFFVRAGGAVTAVLIPRRFRLYVRSGNGWDNRVHRFTADRRHERSADVFDVARRRCGVRLGGPPELPAHDRDACWNDAGPLPTLDIDPF
ncbi:hypothetical protein [Actinomadura atramentaria]|uniref:hypothetical protein n=1 Tax=Actinomadura atramentaria TaxID=1990 RepID=UPI00036A58C6|nr:hypothetical protein [Actinomadura atramentaria]